jgi:hypothetical protein
MKGIIASSRKKNKILEIESNSRYGVFNKSDQPTQFGYLSHLDSLYRQLGDHI